LRFLSIAVLVAMLASHGCLSYQVIAEKPDRRVQAGLSAGQVAFAALIAAVPPKETDGEELGYPGRFGLLLGATVVTDAFVALIGLCSEHCDGLLAWLAGD